MLKEGNTYEAILADASAPAKEAVLSNNNRAFFQSGEKSAAVVKRPEFK